MPGPAACPLGDPSSVTALLRAAGGGDGRVLDALFEYVYAELRGLAHRVRSGGGGETLCTTALVHEAFIKLVPSAEIDWRNRAHFFGVAARAMRQILVDAARWRARRQREAGDAWAVTFDEAAQAAPARAEELIALDEALQRLEALDERQARIVEHRYFVGLTAQETAEVLGVSEATVNREWRAARAWLRRELAES
ncbi:MAG TPA: ECF-type sigma factor [Gemmatimonadaceae bacterium]